MIAAMSPALHFAAHLVTIRVIQSLLVGSVIGLCAAVVLRQSRHDASTRFAVCFSSLIAIATLPMISSDWLGHVPSGAQAQAAITLRDSFAIYVLGVWAFISAWFFIGITRSIWHLRKLRKQCIEIDLAALPADVQETIRAQRMNRKVVVCTSAEVRVPTAIGLFKPAVVIPDWAMEELSAEELTQVLLHEIEHLRRWDDWTNLLLQCVKAVFFFHPVVWWMERNAALERELACDDAVLEQTENPRSYAQCLAHLAERSFVERSLALAQAALGRIRQTTERVRRILNGERPAAPGRALKPVVVLIAAVTVACGVWSGRASTRIAFEDGTPKATIASTAGRSTWDSTTESVAKVVSAVARSSEEIGITQAKLKLGIDCNAKAAVRVCAARSRPSLKRTNSDHLVQLASAESHAMPVAETVLVVVESPAWDPATGPGYQIQMWHFVVLRTTQDPATTQIPSKKI